VDLLSSESTSPRRNESAVHSSGVSPGLRGANTEIEGKENIWEEVIANRLLTIGKGGGDKNCSTHQEGERGDSKKLGTGKAAKKSDQRIQNSIGKEGEPEKEEVESEAAGQGGKNKKVRN